MMVKPVTKSASAHASPPQKPTSWGSWGSSLPNNIMSAVTFEGSHSPEPPPVKPKIEGPLGGLRRIVLSWDVFVVLLEVLLKTALPPRFFMKTHWYRITCAQRRSRRSAASSLSSREVVSTCNSRTYSIACPQGKLK